MTRKEILSHVDHTQLAQTATRKDIEALLDDAVAYGTETVCVSPCFVADAVRYAAARIKVCTVVGFPNGAHTTAVKCFEARQAVRDGAAELDMVVNLGLVREGDFAAVKDEIRRVKEACDGRILKVIVETCLLTEEEKIRLCSVVAEGGADYIKTSTGFGGGGATLSDIRLFAAHVPPTLKIKAAGGISSFADAEAFLKAGADRLGTSRLVRIAKAEDSRN